MTSLVTHSGSAQNGGGEDMSGSIEIYSKLGDYIQRRITLWDLESWLVPRLPIYLENPESAVGQVASAIELCLAELQAGLRSERSISPLLAGHLKTTPILWTRYPEAQPEDITSSANVNQSQSWSTSLAVVNV